MGNAAVVRFLKELRRRRVFRVAGLYVVAVWLLMQAANILFPAWGIPDAAITYLLWAGLLGFPVALAFGWVFDLSAQGIRRTQPVISEDELLRSLPLRRADYVILSVFLVVVVAIVYDTTGRVMQTATYEKWHPSLVEIEPHSMAVLPFTSLSSDPEHEYFADGISEEILNRLSAFRELKVIARTSSFAFKDSGYDIPRISGLLAVNYLLQGSVRRDGQQLRIAVQLVDRNGVQAWASSFDRDLGSIFALQDEIAEEVAKSIVPQIVPPQAEQRLPDLEAYQEYLVGRELVTRRQPYVYRAAKRLTRAIELDPEFAEAYAERAIALSFEMFLDPATARETTSRALQDVEMALALQPDLARAYAAHAIYLPYEDEEREALLRRAIALEPTMVDALTWLASQLADQGRWAESFELRERAARLDPIAPAAVASFAFAQVSRGEFGEAERLALRLLELPHIGDAHFAAPFWFYLWTGRLVEAHQIARRHTLATVGQAQGWRGPLNLVLVYIALGLQKQAEDWQARAELINPKATHVVRHRINVMLAFPPEGRQYDEAIAYVREITEPYLISGDLGFSPAKRYGAVLSLSGDYEGAIRVLEPWVGIPGAERDLARAWQQMGELDSAAALLTKADAEFRARQEAGFLHSGDDLASYAFNSLLLGDKQRALDLLEHAWEAGWRGQNWDFWQLWPLLHDPAWDAVSDEPRFQALVAWVEADIDRQRAQVEKIDTEDDFIARYEAALALHADKVDEVGP
jgi:TolB-like protein/Tfp pilus assembly protein PilF